MKVQYNPKILDAMSLALNSRLLCLEGTARSSKTMIFSDIMYYAVYESTEKFHIIAARDLDAIKTNILKADVVGMLSLHSDAEMKKDSIGGQYVRIIGADGKEKQILLVNYSNEASWKKILGNTIGCIFVDEVNIANKTFIEECFSRQLSANNPHTFWTLNGDDPNHWCYQEYINYCRIFGKIPNSTLSEMEKFQSTNGKRKGWNYMHFTMWDNPIMTPEKIEDALHIYPQGSYYYLTKILGERGIQGDLLFQDYMCEELMVNAFKEDANGRLPFYFTRYSIGLDIGGGRAFNSIHLVGFERDYQRAVVLAEKVFEAKGYEKKKPIIFQFLDKVVHTLGISYREIDGMYIDSAEQNFISDIKDDIYRVYHIEVAGSYKATIKDRIDLMSIGFSTKRILFNVDCRATFDAYKHAQRGDNAFDRLDTNETNAIGDNDRMDSCEYAMTRHMNALMRKGRDY